MTAQRLAYDTSRAVVFALGLVVVACGGGQKAAKGTPMTADPSSDTAFENAFSKPEEDAGSPASAESPTPPSSSGSSDAPPGIPQGTEESAQALLKQFVAPNADHGALTRSLRPSSADYKTLFDAVTAPKIEAAQAKDWESGKAMIKPKPNQTDIKIWSATGADLAAWKGNAKEFPAGYKNVAKHLAAAVTFFRFKFVEPGKETGTAYDGLAFVNGHWVIAPKPWRVLEGAKGADTEEDGSGEAPAKPKPKGKPKGKPKKK